MARHAHPTSDSPESLPGLSAGLKRLRASEIAGLRVPTSVDDAVAQAARAHLAHTHAIASPWKRRVAWTLAAAASIALVVTVSLPFLPAKPQPTVTARTQASDIDGNGRVDVLDAYALARMLEASQEPTQALDVNRDGVIDQRDVDSVAMQAVSLSGGSA